MTAEHLKSLATRIENLMDERDGIGSDIRDIFAEAKSHGYVPKVLRKAITRKRMDPSKRDEEDAILELYEGALGAVGKAVAAVRAGATWKEAAEDHGVARATLARAVAVSKRQNDTKETQELRPAAGEAGTVDTFPVTSGPGSSPANFATGNEAHEGDGNGSNGNGEGRGSEGLQPERQSGRGGDQGCDGGPRDEDGRHPRPEQRSGGTRGGGGDHQPADGQHVVRSGGDEGPVSVASIAETGRGIDALSHPTCAKNAQVQAGGLDCGPAAVMPAVSPMLADDPVSRTGASIRCDGGPPATVGFPTGRTGPQQDEDTALALRAPASPMETATQLDREEAPPLGDDAGHRSEPSIPAEQSVYPVPSLGRVSAKHSNGEGKQSGTNLESRSSAFFTSDSAVSSPGAEPVEPTGNEGWAGERDPAAHEIGAVAEGDSPQRVAPNPYAGETENEAIARGAATYDDNPIPAFLVRQPVRVRRAEERGGA